MSSTPSREESKFHYFLVSAEIEYYETKLNKSPRCCKVNTIYRCANQGIVVEDLKQIQVRLQMAFHQKFLQTHEKAAFITNVTILSTSYLGMFTKSEFNAEPPKADSTKPAEKPQEEAQAASEKSSSTQ